MTSYREPDYNVGIRMSLEDFHAISGVAFNVVVTFGQDQRGVMGMLIIPQGNDFPDSSVSATAWLWSEDNVTSPAETKVTITLGESCDPMLMPEEHSALAPYSGLVFGGVIKRNRNTTSGVVC